MSPNKKNPHKDLFTVDVTMDDLNDMLARLDIGENFTAHQRDIIYALVCKQRTLFLTSTAFREIK